MCGPRWVGSEGRACGEPGKPLGDACTLPCPVSQPVAAQPGEPRLPAHVNTLQRGHRCCSVLGQGDGAIWGAEHLLAALECYGVDNARIEVEGGKGECCSERSDLPLACDVPATGCPVCSWLWPRPKQLCSRCLVGGGCLSAEIPIVDGSALGWASEIQLAGLRPAPSASTAEDGAARDVAAPSQASTWASPSALVLVLPCAPAKQGRDVLQVVTTRDGESFITFFPGPVARITGWSVGAHPARLLPAALL